MELSELQKTLLGGLKVLGLKEDDAVGVMLFLQTEDQQWELLDWMEENIETAGKKDVMEKVAEILKA